MKGSKKIFIDVETTGLSSWKNSIVELSGIIEIDEERREDFQIFIKPNKEEKLDQKVLSILGQTPTQLVERGMDEKIAFINFKKILEKYVDKYKKEDKFFFYAYNSPFDNEFVRRLFKKQGDNFFGSYFWSPDICIMRLAHDHLLDRRGSMLNFKQVETAKALGIEVEEDRLHEAMYDIELSILIYKAIRNPVPVFNG